MSLFFIGIACFFLGLIGAMTAGLVGAEVGRQLVDLLYTHHRDLWIASGRPLGGKITRKEASFWPTWISATVSTDWFSETPEWIRMHPQGLALLRRYRRSFIALVLCTLISMCGLVTFAQAA